MAIDAQDLRKSGGSGRRYNAYSMTSSRLQVRRRGRGARVIWTVAPSSPRGDPEWRNECRGMVAVIEMIVTEPHLAVRYSGGQLNAAVVVVVAAPSFFSRRTGLCHWPLFGYPSIFALNDGALHDVLLAWLPHQRSWQRRRFGYKAIVGLASFALHGVQRFLR